MKNARTYKPFVLCVVAVIGFLSGRFSEIIKSNVYTMNSESGPLSVNSFENLPCLPEDKFQELAQRISLEIPNEKPACDDSHRAKLGKILYLLGRMQIDAPADWLPEFQNDFKDLLGYIAKNSKHLGLDLNQSGSIAYNLSNKKEIYLGESFFKSPPLESVSSLIHEARHSVEAASLHDKCKGGDMPLTEGACDWELSTSYQEAGAYSFEVIFQVGMSLYGKDLSQGDREYLMSSALAIVVNRFNTIPDDLAVKHDVLMALGKNGTVYVVDLFKKSFTPLELKLREKNEKIRRIDFNNRDSGAVLLSNRHHAYSWSQRDGLGQYQADVLDKDLPIYDFARITAPGEFGRTRQTVKTSKGLYKFLKRLPGKSKSELVDLVPPGEMGKVPEFSRFFLAWYGESIFLTKEGNLFMLDQGFDKKGPFKSPKDLQDNRGWRQGTGGVTYQDLFLLNRAGELKIAQSHYEEIDDNNSKSTYYFEGYDFRTPSRAVKYFQGLKYHAALTENGRIYVRAYGEEVEAQELIGPNIIDFTIIHNPEIKSQIAPK